jgi:hypothetical protein
MRTGRQRPARAESVRTIEAARRRPDVIRAQKLGGLRLLSNSTKRSLNKPNLTCPTRISSTHILAPAEGMVTESSVQVGGRARQPGTTLTTVIPLNNQRSRAAEVPGLKFCGLGAVTAEIAGTEFGRCPTSRQCRWRLRRQRSRIAHGAIETPVMRVKLLVLWTNLATRHGVVLLRFRERRERQR